MTVDLPLFHFCLARSAELLPRVELGTSSLPRMRSTTELKQHFLLLRRGRSLMSGKRDSNPRPPAWKASALSTELFPQKSNSGFLRESWLRRVANASIHSPCTRLPRKGATFVAVGADGFEPPKSKTADLQSAPFGHSGTHPFFQ